MKNKELLLNKTVEFGNLENPVATVVLIHGIASDSTTFDSLLKFIKNTGQLNNLRFLAFDLLGAGSSLKNDDLNYDFDEQLVALKNSIARLKNITPLILLGHSMGTMIATRYASLHPDDVKSLILISAPVYTKADLENPIFKMAIQAFSNSVEAKHPGAIREKAFSASIQNIVLNPDNYDVLANLHKPITMIYGEGDQIIGQQNYTDLVQKNQNIVTIKTPGRHGVTEDKFAQITKAIEEASNA